MNFLMKQNFFRVLYQRGIPWEISNALYKQYIEGQMKGPMYPGTGIPDFNIQATF